MNPGAWRRWLPLLLLVVLAAAAYLTGLHRQLDPAVLRAHHTGLEQFVSERWLVAPLVFVLTYAVAAATSLPGAALLTIAGGFLFGTCMGALWSILGATAGAVVLFLAARTALGDLLRCRATPWLQRMEGRFRRDAFTYLLVLRLIPLFPFWLVNLVPAFLGVPLRTFALATVLGIVPGALVYASAGRGLDLLLDRGEEPKLGLLLEPQMLGPLLGLAALAVLPLLYRHWRQRPRRP